MRVRPLTPAEMFPASTAGVSVSMLDLRTGIRMRVAERGDKRAPAVLMLHGWAASLYTFRHALELLPERGFRAIAVDLRGFGLSDHPSANGAYSLDAYLTDVDAVVDALRLDRFALVGHSMGGGLSLQYALKRPERLRALGLINPTELVAIPALVAMRLMPREVIEALGERAVPRWLTKFVLEHVAFGDASRLTPRDVDEYWAATQIPGYVGALRRTVAEFDWRPLSSETAASLAVPPVVVLASNDRLVRHARAAAERLARAEVHELAGGHCVHEERPAEVYGMLGAFFERFAKG